MPPLSNAPSITRKPISSQRSRRADRGLRLVRIELHPQAASFVRRRRQFFEQRRQGIRRRGADKRREVSSPCHLVKFAARIEFDVAYAEACVHTLSYKCVEISFLFPEKRVFYLHDELTPVISATVAVMHNRMRGQERPPPSSSVLTMTVADSAVTCSVWTKTPKSATHGVPVTVT